MRKVLISLVLAFFAGLVVFSGAQAHTDVTPLEAKYMIDSNDQLIVLDVREVSEYCDADGQSTDANGHIPGALNYPWSSGVLQSRYEELPMDSPILVVCRLGSRSNSAANFLDSEGYLYIFDMLGGMTAWEWERALCVDSDEDDFNDDLDNCPDTYNPSQEDSDLDGIGNACDQDCPNLDMLNPVNFMDFAILAQNWQTVPLNLAVDLDGNQFVDINDLALFVKYWLSDCYEDNPEETAR